MIWAELWEIASSYQVRRLEKHCETALCVQTEGENELLLLTVFFASSSAPLIGSGLSPVATESEPPQQGWGFSLLSLEP